MTFQSSRISPRNRRRKNSSYHFVKRKYTKSKKTRGVSMWIQIIVYGFLACLTLGIGTAFFLYEYIVRQLPDVEGLKNMTVKEASTLYDRNGRELYTFFSQEKRTYVDYEEISPHMINAIVAGEDKRYWENPWFDLMGLARAAFNGLRGKKIEGTSTLTQQLIRNTIIENRSSTESTRDKIERKAKEFILAYRLTKDVTKEDILEMYLNKIAFGSNAYGVEQASRTFFGKHISDITVLEGSILASLPKGPTFFSPYSRYDRLVGYMFTADMNDKKEETMLITPEELDSVPLVAVFRERIAGMTGTSIREDVIEICHLEQDFFKQWTTFRVDRRGCSLVEYKDLQKMLNALQISDTENNRVLEYQSARKDFILQRMLEDGYITFDEYKEAILEGIGYQFKEYKENITYPHFVMYVREYLEEKYWPEVLNEWGLQIYTTLDSAIQNKAQEIITRQAESNKSRYDANNAALINIDNTNGDILAMVWGVDYFNKEIQGNVNMITSTRQPWSSFKPFVYALAIDKNPIGPQTPIFDVPTAFASNWSPKNYDGKYLGKMTLMSALNYSRNTTAIKMYFLAGEQKEIVDFMKSTGVKTLRDDYYYGAPMALWTAEMTPLELVGAYSVFANMWEKVEINPILKILDAKGNIIEEKGDVRKTPVLDPVVARIMNDMLKNTASRPAGWSSSLTLSDGRDVWAKTGTSNKPAWNGSRILPGDLWTAWYTPQYTTVVWAGNTNGKAMNASATGLGAAAPIWKDFMNYLHQWKEPRGWNRPKEVKIGKMSKVSGLLAPIHFDASLTVNNFYKNLPTQYDNNFKTIQYDILCNGRVTPETPVWAIATGTILEYHSIDPNRPVWEASVAKWIRDHPPSEFSGRKDIIANYRDVPCERDLEAMARANVQLSVNILPREEFFWGNNPVEITYISANPIIKLQIVIGGKVIQDIPMLQRKTWVYKGNIVLPRTYWWAQELTIRAVDTVYASGEVQVPIFIIGDDTVPPEIRVTNPTQLQTFIKKEELFLVNGEVYDRWWVRKINVYVDGRVVQSFEGTEYFSVALNTDNPLSSGKHLIKIDAYDMKQNKSEKSFVVDVE